MKRKEEETFWTMIFKPYLIFPVFMLVLFHYSSKSRMETTSALKPGLDISRISAHPAGTFLRPFLQSRTPGSPGSRAVQIFLLQHFSFLGWKTEIDQFTESVPPVGTPVKFTNLIFTLNPDARRKLVIAAHYDSKVKVPGQKHDGEFIGATDSAWPCALMAELAFALTPRLKNSPSFNDLSLQMIFFDGEEAQVDWSAKDSIYGARHLAAEWAKDPESKIKSIELFILLDLLGAANPTFYPLISGTRPQYLRLASVEDKILKNNGSTVKQYFAKQTTSQIRGFHVEDDHAPFMRIGVPVLHLIPVPFPSVWHTMKDDESCLDNGVISDLTIIMHAYLEEYFQLPQTNLEPTVGEINQSKDL